MKIIELNIGLSTTQGDNLNPISILNALTERGFTLIKYRVVESVCKDGKERCLAVKAECPNDWQEQLSRLSNGLKQDCIAVVGFIGHAPYDAFVPSLWVEPVSDDKVGEPTGDGHTLGSFITYLKETLIPDLKESGYEATAEDFETLLKLTGND